MVGKGFYVAGEELSDFSHAKRHLSQPPTSTDKSSMWWRWMVGKGIYVAGSMWWRWMVGAPR